MKSKCKGFTLIELIVVIIIIGILSSLLVVVYGKYIESSRLSNDQLMIKQYNDALERYQIESEIDHRRLIASDIRYILENEIGQNLSFEPKSRDYHYWYNVNNKKIELLRLQDVKQLGNEVQPTLWALSLKPEAIYYPYILLDDVGDSFVTFMNDFYHEEHYVNLQYFTDYIRNFNDREQQYFSLVLNNNLFVGQNGKYQLDESVITNVIIARNVSSITNNLFTGNPLTHLYFPYHIQEVDITAFNETPNLELLSFNQYIVNISTIEFNQSKVTKIGGLIINQDEYLRGSIKDAINPFLLGNGTIDDPYQITNVEQLKAIHDYSNQHFILMNEIDLSNEVVMIDSLSGTLNGNNKGLSNFSLNIQEEGNYGLFREITSTGKVHDIKLNNVIINVDITLPNIEKDLRVSALASINKGTIENVTLNGSINLVNNTSPLYIGGACSINEGSVSRITSSLAMNITTQSSESYIGGVVGSNTGHLQRLSNDGAITVTGNGINVGGIAGMSKMMDTNIIIHQGLINRAPIRYGDGSSGAMGGVFGKVLGVSLTSMITMNDVVNLVQPNKYSNSTLAYAHIVGDAKYVAVDNFYQIIGQLNNETFGKTSNSDTMNKVSSSSVPTQATLDQLNLNSKISNPFKLINNLLFLDSETTS